MLGRLIFGILKGVLVGGLIGFGLGRLGFIAPGPIVAYLAAALTGVLIGLVAGKPIWAKDAKIEAGMKAFVGALLGAGLMFAARRWLTMGLPIALGPLAVPNLSLNEPPTSIGTVGGLAITSLAAIAGLLGGFYEADNDPAEGEAPAASGAKRPAAANQRIVADDAADDADEDQSDAADQKRSKK